MTKCKYCAELIQDEAKVCRYCGSSLETEKKFSCYSCKKIVTIPIGDYEHAMRVYTQFHCPHCDAPIEIPRSPTKATAPEPQSSYQLATVISIVAIIIAVVCVILLIRSKSHLEHSVSDTVENSPNMAGASASSKDVREQKSFEKLMASTEGSRLVSNIHQRMRNHGCSWSELDWAKWVVIQTVYAQRGPDSMNDTLDRLCEYYDRFPAFAKMVMSMDTSDSVDALISINGRGMDLNTSDYDCIQQFRTDIKFIKTKM